MRPASGRRIADARDVVRHATRRVRYACACRASPAGGRSVCRCAQSSSQSRLCISINRDAVRLVYGADANGAEISEAITSTSAGFRQKIAAAGPLEPAFPGY